MFISKETIKRLEEAMNNDPSTIISLTLISEIVETPTGLDIVSGEDCYYLSNNGNLYHIGRVA